MTRWTDALFNILQFKKMTKLPNSICNWEKVGSKPCPIVSMPTFLPNTFKVRQSFQNFTKSGVKIILYIMC